MEERDVPHHTEWIELFNDVFGQERVPVDALFVHGWGDLYDEMIAFVAEEFRATGAKYIVLNGEPAYDAFPGAKGIEYWKEKLTTLHGIPENVIKSFTPARHTREEADGFIAFAKQEGIERAAVISVPQHILRAFMTNIGVAQKEGVNVKLYSRTLPHVDWEGHIDAYGLLSDRDTERTTRVGRVVSECARIIEYRIRMEHGEPFAIASVPEALAYIKNRDT